MMSIGILGMDGAGICRGEEKQKAFNRAPIHRKKKNVTTVSELSHYAGLLRDASSNIKRRSLELARYKIQAAKDVV